MSKVANTEGINIRNNAGKVGSGNEVDAKGKSECDYTFLTGCLDSFIKSLSFMTTLTGLGQNTALGNTTDIQVQGKNTEKGCIGAENKYKKEGELFLVLLGWYKKFT